MNILSILIVGIFGALIVFAMVSAINLVCYAVAHGIARAVVEEFIKAGWTPQKDERL